MLATINMLIDTVKLMRPKQYVKNLFIFAPLLFSFHFKQNDIILTLYAFILFSFVASSIYIFNDLMDIEEDKNHPKKCKRPLAANLISVKTAIFLITLLATSSMLVAFLINHKLFSVLLIYFFMNIAYSVKLKHIAVIDIFIISTGFVLRLYAGNSILNSHLSIWIIIMTFLLALFLALAKRRDDVLLSLKGQKTRKNIDGYNLEFVNATMVLMAGVVIVGYIQYTISPDVVERLHSQYLYLTSIFVILGILRYMQITFVEEKSGSPTSMLLNDRFLQITIVMWLVSFFVVINIGENVG